VERVHPQQMQSYNFRWYLQHQIPELQHPQCNVKA
jgi:hypothetical protein